MEVKKVEIRGRRFYLTPSGWVPSVTTLLKDTKPFNRKYWMQRLTTKGLTPYEATIYLEHFSTAHLLSTDQALEVIGGWVNNPMGAEDAIEYMDWKQVSSSERGLELHKYIEDNFPVGEEFTITPLPKAADTTTQNLVQSLVYGGIVEDIARINSLEKTVYYFNNEIGGYAGTEDIDFVSKTFGNVRGDWKTKEPKDYSPTKYASEYKMQLIAYAAADVSKGGQEPDHLAVFFPFTDSSPAKSLLVPRKEHKDLWARFKPRLIQWWETYSEDWDMWREIENEAGK